MTSQALADQRSEFLAAQKRMALARPPMSVKRSCGGQDFRRAGLPGRAAEGPQEAEIAVGAARQKLASLGAGTAESTQGLTRYESARLSTASSRTKKISVGGRSRTTCPSSQVADLSGVWIELTVPART